MPYEKLLDLVESKQLDITTVSLAQVTADFIKYIESLENRIDPGLLSDFVTVAAKLILIKSRALVPDEPLAISEEKEVKNFEARLMLYKEFRKASNILRGLWYQQTIACSRPLLLGFSGAFYPPDNLTPLDLLSVLTNLSIELGQLIKPDQEIKTVLISLEEKMNELIANLNQSSNQNLKNLMANKSRAETVVIFLAILHLLKNRVINVDQNEWIKLI